MSLTFVGTGDARHDDRRPAKRSRRVGGLRGGDTAVAEARACADDAGANGADDYLHARLPAPRERGRKRYARDFAVDTRPGSDCDAQEPTPGQRAHGVRQRDREGAARGLDVTDRELYTEPGAHGRDLTVQRAADDRRPGKRVRLVAVLLRMPDGVLKGRVRQLHHVRARLRLNVEAPGEVRGHDVEAG